MRSILALAAAFAAAQSASADIIFSDTEFATANWGTDLVNIGASGSMTASQVSGGNPGFCRQVDQTPGPNLNDHTYALHRFGTTTATRYDPATQGAILSLAFSIDFRDDRPAGSFTDQVVYFGAKQGTNLYAGPSINTNTSLGTFTTFTASGLSAADFLPVGSAPAFDISAAGAPIRFGFITRTINDNGAFPSRAEYDNWSVHISQAPAPASISILGAAGLFARRRRR